jgi:hypothetical protein
LQEDFMANRNARIIGGTIAAVIGTLVAAGGGATMALVGSDDRLSTDRHGISTSTAALAMLVDDVEGTSGITTVLGQPRLEVAARATDTPLFIGVGPAGAVAQYLADVRIDRVDDVEVDPFALEVTAQAGSKTSAAAPATQTFWVAQASGTDPSVSWKVRNGDYRIVVMNADGSPRIAASAKFGLVVPRLYDFGVVGLLAGALIGLVGGALVALGLKTPRRPVTPSADGPSVPVSVA